MEAVLAMVFSVICHQMPDRSPSAGGAILPLCFRCAGLCSGMLACYLWLIAHGGWRRRMPDLRNCLIAFACTLPMALDGFGKILGLWDSPGWARALTGCGVGVALPLLLLPLASSGDAPKPSIARALDVGAPLAGSVGMAGAALIAGSPVIFSFVSWAFLFGLLMFGANWLLAVRSYLYE